MSENEVIPTIDHVYSMCHDLGGENHRSNIQSGCLSCNRFKGNLHVYEFYKKSELFTDELWHTFIRSFVSRMIGREITDDEVDVMSARLAKEAESK